MKHEILMHNYRDTRSLFFKLNERLKRRLANNSFVKLTKRKQHHLIQKINKLVERLQNLERVLKLGTAGVAFSVALNLSTVQAQEQETRRFFDGNRKLRQSENVEKRIVNRKQTSRFKNATDVEAIYFEQKRGTANPFGGKNPWDGLTTGGNTVDIDNDGDLDLFECITYRGT